MSIGKDSIPDEHGSDTAPGPVSTSAVEDQAQEQASTVLHPSAAVSTDAQQSADETAAFIDSHNASVPATELSAADEHETLFAGAAQSELDEPGVSLNAEGHMPGNEGGATVTGDFDNGIYSAGDSVIDDAAIEDMEAYMTEEALLDGDSSFEDLETMLDNTANHPDDYATAAPLASAACPPDRLDHPDLSVLDELKALLEAVLVYHDDVSDEAGRDSGYAQALLNQASTLGELQPLLQSCIEYLDSAADNGAGPVSSSASLYSGSVELKNLLEVARDRLFSLGPGAPDADYSDTVALLEELYSTLELSRPSDTGSPLFVDSNATGASVADDVTAADFAVLPASSTQDHSQDAELDTEALLAEMDELLQETGVDAAEDDASFEDVDADIDTADPVATQANLEQQSQAWGQTAEAEPVQEGAMTAVPDSEIDTKSALDPDRPDTVVTPEHTITQIVGQSEPDGADAAPAAASVVTLDQLKAMAGRAAESDDGDGGLPLSAGNENDLDQRDPARTTEASQHSWEEGPYERLDDDSVVVIRKHKRTSDGAEPDTVVCAQTQASKRVMLAALSVAASVAAGAVLFWSLTDDRTERAPILSAATATPADTVIEMHETQPVPQHQQSGTGSVVETAVAAIESGRSDAVPGKVAEEPPVASLPGPGMTGAASGALESADHQARPLPDNPVLHADINDLGAQDSIAILARMDQDFFIADADPGGEQASSTDAVPADTEIHQAAAKSKGSSADQYTVDALHSRSGVSADLDQPGQPSSVLTGNEGRYVWLVHIASYFGHPPSEKELGYLDEADVPYEIRRADVDGSTWYRVLVSNFTTYRDAQEYSRMLETNLGNNNIWISKTRL